MKLRAFLPVLPLIALMLAASLLPIAMFLVNGLQKANGDYSLIQFQRVIDKPAYLLAVWNTIKTSVLVDILVLLLAYPVALTIHMAKGGFRNALMIAVLLPFFTSVLVRSYAWSVVLGLKGPVNQFLVATGILDEPYLLGHSTIGTFVGLVHILMPPAVLSIYTIMSRIDENLMTTARSLGAGKLTAFFTIFFPLSLPGVLLGGLLTFVMALGAFVIPQLLGGVGNLMFGQVIVMIATISLDWNFASALSLIFLLIMALPIYGLVRGGQFGDATGGRPARSPPTALSRLLAMFTAPAGRIVTPLLRAADRLPSILPRGLRIFVATAVILFLVVPELLIVLLSFGDPNYLSWPPTRLSGEGYALFFQSAPWVRALGQSLQFGLLTMAISLVIGTAAAYGIARGDFPFKSLIVSLALVPLILPDIIPAIAYYIAASTFHMSGSVIAIVAGQAVTATSMVLLVMLAVFRSLKVEVELAARASGAGPVRAFFNVVVPIVWPSFIVAGLFSFLNAFDNLLTPLFVGGKYQTLPVYMWLQMREATSPLITVVASIMVFAVVTLGFVATYAQRLQARQLENSKI